MDHLKKSLLNLLHILHWKMKSQPLDHQGCPIQSHFSGVSGADINLLCLSRNWSIHFKPEGNYGRKGQDSFLKKTKSLDLFSQI